MSLRKKSLAVQFRYQDFYVQTCMMELLATSPSARACVMRLGARPSSSLRRLAPSSNLQTRLLQTEAEAASGPGATICTTRFRPPLRSPPPSPGREHRRSVTEISLQTLRLSSSPSSPLSSSDKSPASARHGYRPFSTTASLHCSHRRSEELDSSDTQDPSQPDEKESLGAMPSGRKMQHLLFFY
jgi:hypothetical protein